MRNEPRWGVTDPPVPGTTDGKPTTEEDPYATLIKRRGEIQEEMNRMSEELTGCDWCCGGGYEAYEELHQELVEIEVKLGMMSAEDAE